MEIIRKAALVCGAVFVCAQAVHAQESQGQTPPANEKEAESVEVPPEITDPSQVDVKQILARLDDLYRSDSSIAEMELTVVKPRKTRTLKMKAWSRGEDKALIVIEAPARDKGTATLKVDKNLWNYLPKINRTIRIPPSMMLGSWMGSDFTNDDLVREASLEEDFDVRLVGRSEKPRGWLLELTAKPDLVGLWDRIEYVISPNGALPVEARYFDRKGRLARVMTFDRVKVFDGRRIPSRMTLVPMDRKGEPEKKQKTIMTYLDLKLDAGVPESTFSLSRLERNR